MVVRYFPEPVTPTDLAPEPEATFDPGELPAWITGLTTNAPEATPEVTPEPLATSEPVATPQPRVKDETEVEYYIIEQEMPIPYRLLQDGNDYLLLPDNFSFDYPVDDNVQNSVYVSSTGTAAASVQSEPYSMSYALSSGLNDLVQYFSDVPPISVNLVPLTETVHNQTPFATYSAAGTTMYSWRTTILDTTTQTTSYKYDIAINSSFWVLCLMICGLWFVSHIFRRAFR